MKMDGSAVRQLSTRAFYPANTGFHMIEAENSENMVAAAQASGPYLILMVIQLQARDGYEATRRVNANPDLRSIPIVVITSYYLSGEEDEARLAGSDDYMAKALAAAVGKDQKICLTHICGSNA
jgi:two-component system cell cycle response regulator DivK